MAGQRDIYIFDDRDGAARFAVEKWVEISSTANDERGRFAVALSGGRTPVDFYERLSVYHKPLPWDKTHIFPADERFVPPSDRESNFRLIKEHLLHHLTIPKQNIHPVITGEGTPDDAARRYEEEIRQFFALGAGQLPVFDLILLGMGEDGHTASLFPGAASLKKMPAWRFPSSPTGFPASA